MFQNKQKVVVVSSGDPARVIKVQSASGTPDPSRYPIVDTTGVSGRDQSVQIVSGGDPTRFPILRGVSDARATADSVITALTPAAWYRNATGVTEAGGFASQWDDYSGNARHLVQATGTNQPAYAAGVFTFDGADNFMQTATFVMANPVTAVMVVKSVSHTNADRLMDGFNTDTMVIRQIAPSPNIESWGGTAYTSDITSLAVGSRGILLRVWNGASSVLRHNDNTEITDGTGTIGTTGGITLARAGAAGTTYSNISVEELVVFNSALSLANRNAVITALNNALTVF